ncbi:MAG: hypothetical protein KGI25_10355, partial [Thaumarchaeota archaeon]|nr:hypothetical protein [Nitrososphaerota archaeon]
QADAVRDLLSQSLGLEGENIGDREAYISKLKGMRFIEDPNSMVAKVLNGIKNDENIVLGIQNQAAKNYAAIVERNPNLTQAEHDEYAKAFVQVKNIVENHMNSPEETAQKFYDTFGKISALSQDPNSKVGDLFTNQSLEFKPDFITDSEVHQSYQRAQHQINVLMGHEDISPGINIGNIVENPAALTQLVLESKRAIEQIPSEDPQHKLRAGSAFLDHIISTLHQVSDPNVNIEDMLSRLVSSDIPIFANPSQSIYNDLVDRIPGVKRGASPPAPHSVNPGGPIGPTNTQQFASLVNQVVGEVNGNATNTAGSTVGQIHATNLGALAPGSASALQGKLEVPIMAIGGIMALVGASQGWEPWLGQWSQGNVSDTIMPTTQNRALAKVSEIPGNPDTASTWSGDLAPFHINISFRGFVKNREDTDRLRSMVYDSVNSEMTVTATNDNVSERRDSSVHMMAHEFLQN